MQPTQLSVMIIVARAMMIVIVAKTVMATIVHSGHVKGYLIGGRIRILTAVGRPTIIYDGKLEGGVTAAIGVSRWLDFSYQLLYPLR